MITIKDLRKSFGAINAVDGLSLRVEPSKEAKPGSSSLVLRAKGPIQASGS